MSLKISLEKALFQGESKKSSLLKEKPPSLIELIEESQDYAKENRGFLRPSAILGCDRQNVFRLTRAPANPQQTQNRLQRIFDNGTAVHLVVQGYLAKHPDWWFAPEAKVYKEVSGVLIKGSCDGILVRRSDSYRFGIEVKTIKHDLWLKLTRPDPKHVIQASIYAALNDVWWITIYYWSKDTQDHKEYPVCYDKERWDAVKERVAYLRDLAERSINKGGSMHWTNINKKTLTPYDPKQCSPQQCDYYEFCKHMGAPI